MTNKKQKVIAAMSGGVDSSIATALLLRHEGYNVVGVFMKFWFPRQARDKPLRENLCCSAEAQADARRIARKLEIPFYVLDVRKEFKEKVVDYLIEEYRKGRTPNPCVECNRWIKFKFLMDKAMALKADYIATGHYARIQRNLKFKRPGAIPPNKNLKLRTAKDKQKDQTYFLWTLTQNQLRRVMFPIGDYTKKEVRAMARKWDLPVYEKKESQEICFVNTNINEFLRKRIGVNKGLIITTKGEKIGEHEGLAYYTIGQRKGIKIGGIGPASPSLGGPFYVVDKDFKKNALIVAQSDFNEALFKKEMRVKSVNWINKPKKFPFKCNVKIRYLTPSVPATINRNKVIFDKKQRAITPGQSAVFYKRNELLGGGIIM